MPIRIDRRDNSNACERIAWLCDGQWEMPAQLEALMQWLLQARGKLAPADYIADLGFSPRPGALGGGGIVSREMMEVMLELGFQLYLSEYPDDAG